MFDSQQETYGVHEMSMACMVGLEAIIDDLVMDVILLGAGLNLISETTPHLRDNVQKIKEGQPDSLELQHLHTLANRLKRDMIGRCNNGETD